MAPARHCRLRSWVRLVSQRCVDILGGDQSREVVSGFRVRRVKVKKKSAQRSMAMKIWALTETPRGVFVCVLRIRCIVPRHSAFQGRIVYTPRHSHARVSRVPKAVSEFEDWHSVGRVCMYVVCESCCDWSQGTGVMAGCCAIGQGTWKYCCPASRYSSQVKVCVRSAVSAILARQASVAVT